MLIRWFQSSMLDYLKTLNLASTALDSEINTAVSRYSSASYTADQCCQEPALQLATTCTDKGSYHVCAHIWACHVCAHFWAYHVFVCFRTR